MLMYNVHIISQIKCREFILCELFNIFKLIIYTFYFSQYEFIYRTFLTTKQGLYSIVLFIYTARIEQIEKFVFSLFFKTEN